MPALHPLPVSLMSSPIAFAAANPVGTVKVPALGIRNLDPNGILIDKINISGISTSFFAPLIELRWRNQPITNGFVVFDSVAWPQNRGGEIFAKTIFLSRPMYLPAGEFLGVAIRNDLFPATIVTNLVVTATGKQSAEPAERWLPYLTSYLGPVYNAAGAAVADQSDPTALGNPFDVPLSVERMIGRILTVPLGGGGNLGDVEVNATWLQYLLRLSDHRDHFWVAQPTPLPLVFNAVDRSWLLNTELEPKGFLRAEFEGVLSGGAGNSRAIVGLVGYRRIN